MKCPCWHRQLFEMARVPCLYDCLSACLYFKGMYVSDTATSPGFLGVQTRSTTCAMTTDQPPAASDCICYIPRKTEQNMVIQFVLVTYSMKTHQCIHQGALNVVVGLPYCGNGCGVVVYNSVTVPPLATFSPTARSSDTNSTPTHFLFAPYNRMFLNQQPPPRHTHIHVSS